MRLTTGLARDRRKWGRCCRQRGSQVPEAIRNQLTTTLVGSDDTCWRGARFCWVGLVAILDVAVRPVQAGWRALIAARVIAFGPRRSGARATRDWIAPNHAAQT